MSPSSPVALAPRVSRRAAAGFDAAVARLADYLTHPAISCDPDHAADVCALAARLRADLEALGLERARVLELDDALPCVAAEWMQAGADAPTVLIYGHFDVQPVKGEPWLTPPHEAVIKDDDRLYARGSADDMGGWLSHLAAIEAWLAEHGALPVNVRLLIEGEEEIGSPSIERFMDAHPDAFEADVLVLTDCENPSTEIPGLTVSLRGLMEVELTVSALSADGHSGLWGNMVPDVSIALMKLVARLTDDDGRLALGRVDVPMKWREAAYDVPLTSEVIHEGANILDGVAPLPLRGRPAAEWMWRQPSLTVVATTLPSREVKKNALRTQASATLSVRVAPGQTVEELFGLIHDAVTTDVPGGVKVELSVGEHAGEGWLYELSRPVFDAVERAYMATWGRGPLLVGVGGSIPIVALFGRRFGDLPLILNGVMDPKTTAHGPNESMHLGVFRKAIAANVHLYAELGALGRGGLSGE